MKKLKVGIIGSGAIAQNAHMPSYAALDNVEMAAVADSNPQNAQAAAEKFSVPKVFSDYRELLALKEIDAVSICTPNANHKPATVDALRAGKHVLVEKPIALNATEAQAMIEAGKKAKKILMVAQCQRFTTESQIIKRAVKEGALGEIYYAEASYLRRRGIPGWGAFTSKAISGGGPLIDVGVHVLDLALYLMGFPKPVSVSGTAFAKIGPKPRKAMLEQSWSWDPAKFEVEDMGIGLVRFENGACLYLKASWAINSAKTDNGVMLAGTEGGCQNSPLEIYREDFGSLVNITPTQYPRANSYLEEVRLFVEAIRKGLPSPVPGEQALITTKILDAIYKSGKTGKEVRLT